MAKRRRRRRRQNDSPLATVWRSDLGKRFLGLLGLAAIVGALIVVLLAAGLLGNQGGGTTSTGVKILPAVVMDPPPPSGVADFEVGTTVGKFAPDFEASRLDTGERVKLSAFRGRPVYLNWWGSFCLPCVVEMPDIDKLMKSHPELIVIGINRREPVGRAQGFLDSINLKDGTKGMRYTVAVMDPNDTLYDTFRALGMPVSIFIDANGRITEVRNGLILLPTMEEFFAEALASAPLSDDEMAEGAPSEPGSYADLPYTSRP